MLVASCKGAQFDAVTHSSPRRPSHATLAGSLPGTRRGRQRKRKSDSKMYRTSLVPRRVRVKRLYDARVSKRFSRTGFCVRMKVPNLKPTDRNNPIKLRVSEGFLKKPRFWAPRPLPTVEPLKLRFSGDPLLESDKISLARSSLMQGLS